MSELERWLKNFDRGIVDAMELNYKLITLVSEGKITAAEASPHFQDVKADDLRKQAEYVQEQRSKVPGL